MALLAGLVPTTLCLQYLHRRGTPALARAARVLAVVGLLVVCTTTPPAHPLVVVGVIGAAAVAAAVAWPHRPAGAANGAPLDLTDPAPAAHPDPVDLDATGHGAGPHEPARTNA